jgi:hypothetical protein
MMARWDSNWGEWKIVGNSRGYDSPVLSWAIGCLVKVGDELRQARYLAGGWDDFVSVAGGRLRSDPVPLHSKVYGVGLEGQLVRNSWLRGRLSSWQEWENLGEPPAGAILGTPAIVQHEGDLYVVVKGSDNRLYLRVNSGEGDTWGDWEQGDKLSAGQFTGDPFTFSISERDESTTELVLTGRSLEGEMASISREIGEFVTSTTPDSLWRDWSVVGNSGGYSSPAFVKTPIAVHCIVKVGDEVRHARYRDGRWDAFAPVDGGRFRSDPVAIVGTNSIEVYGIGMEGQLARNVWAAHAEVWQGWEDLGRPEPGIVGTPAVQAGFRDRYVVVKGSNNRLYLSYSDNNGESWDPWEQGESLGKGIVSGNVSARLISGADRLELVVIGRSMENEMASISLALPNRG